MYNKNTSHLPSLLSREQQRNVLKSKMDVRNGLTRLGARAHGRAECAGRAGRAVRAECTFFGGVLGSGRPSHWLSSLLLISLILNSNTQFLPSTGFCPIPKFNMAGKLVALPKGLLPKCRTKLAGHEWFEL